MQTQFVDNEEDLLGLCEIIAKSDLIAIDTEFMREKTYFAQLCLIQIATEQIIACVDPLAIENLEPLLALIYDEKRIKILHAARQDLEIFFDLKGDVPRPVFDTQIAATLLGHGDQLGYAKLVKAMLSINVDKEHSRTDWAKRPLDEAQIKYAENDVRHLIPMYRDQLEQLRTMNRETWLKADFDNLTDLNLYAPKQETLWRRIKGTRILKKNQLCVIQHLAIWREAKAKNMDYPRKWVLPDDLMIELARRTPTSMDALERVRGWKSNLNKYAEDFLKIIIDARQIPEDHWPILDNATPLSVKQEAIVDFLMGIVRLKAIKNDVTPAVLATRKDLERLVLDNDDVAVLKGWRYELVGNDLQQFIRGEKTIHINRDEATLD